MRKALAVLAVFIIVLTGCGKSKSNEIRIALVGPLTGDLAAMGQGMKKATQMAVDDANAAGMFPGMTVTMEAFDDRADPKEAVSVANRIISDSRIYGVVGHLTSGCSIPASQVYAKRNLVMITPATTNPKLTLQGLSNVFRLCATDNMQGAFVADFVYDTLKKNRIAVIHDKTAYGQGLAENFQKRLQERGGTTVSFDGIDVGDKDFKALLTTIKSKDPQLVYFGGIYTEFGLISKQSKELGLEIPIFSDDGSFSTEYIKIAGKASEGNYVAMAGAPAEKLPKSQSFIDAFKAKYPGVDMQPYDPYTYDAAMIVLTAVAKTNRDRTAMPGLVRTISYDGILGTNSFDENGDTRNKIISIYQVKNGVFVNVK